MDQPGWIDAPRASLTHWDTLVRLAREGRRDGLTRVVVCGMGGSSLVAAGAAWRTSTSRGRRP